MDDGYSYLPMNKGEFNLYCWVGIVANVNKCEQMCTACFPCALPLHIHNMEWLVERKKEVSPRSTGTGMLEIPFKTKTKARQGEGWDEQQIDASETKHPRPAGFFVGPSWTQVGTVGCSCSCMTPSL
jgi:hypothetical protein